MVDPGACPCTQHLMCIRCEHTLTAGQGPRLIYGHSASTVPDKGGLVARHSKTTPVVWSIGKLEKAWKAPAPEEGELRLPNFQRAPVWSTDQQSKLIHSLKSGYPIGSLLFYERPAGGAKAGKAYLLVDGLQRTLAIRAYVEKPLTLIDPEDLESSVLDSLHARMEEVLPDGGLDNDHFARAVGDWLRKTATLGAEDGFDASNLVLAISEAAGKEAPGPADKATYSLARKFLDELREAADIGKIELPIIIYEGDEGNLPEIFERINRQGTLLSRFDVFAASWVNQATLVTNKKIVDFIDAKYQSMTELGFSYDGLPEDTNEFTLYEYLFGFGKLLTENYPLLFGRTKDAAKPESIAFTLATIMHGHRLSEMKDLPSFFIRNGDDQLNPHYFETATLAACDYLEEILKPFIGIRLNRQGPALNPEHTEYQIASFICRLATARFSMTASDERDGWKSDWKALRVSIPQHYLYDALRLTWRGAGDTRLFERTWDDVDLEIVSPHYLSRISRKEWEDQLTLWFEDQMNRAQKKRPSVRGLDKLFLKFVYSDKVTVHDDQGIKFDLEHLYPVKRLVNLIDDGERGWPISCIANLALLPSDINRKKKAETVAEHIKKLPAARKRRTLDILRRYLLCRIPDVDIPKNSKGRDLLTREEYEQFLEKRYEAMKQQVLRSLRVTRS